MILNICEVPDVLAVMRIVNLAINIIRIAVPIILIVVTLIQYMTAVTEAEKFSKTSKVLINRCIAAVAIFLVPTIIRILVNIISPGDDGYAACLNNASKEGISAAYVRRASDYVSHANTSLSRTDYTIAYNEVADLEDGSEKTSLMRELEEIEVKVRNKEIEHMKELHPDSDSSEYGTKYSKEDIIAMDEATVKAMSNQEFIEFIGSAAVIVYKERGGVLPSVTIGQAILESGYGDHFTNNTFNVYGLHGYPGERPLNGFLRAFTDFYDSTYFHSTYFEAYPSVYGNFLRCCENKDAIGAASYLGAYAGGEKTYGSTVQQLIRQYNLTEYDNY